MTAGKQEWFDKIYTDTRRLMMEMARMRLKEYPELTEDAEDLVQETYMQMYRKYDTLAEYENIAGWLVEALKRNTWSRVRKNGRERQRVMWSMDEPDHTEPVVQGMNPTEEEVFRREMAKYYREKITRQIGEEGYWLMRAHYGEGLPLDVLAQKTGISIAALKMRFLRWRKCCRNISLIILLFFFV